MGAKKAAMEEHALLIYRWKHVHEILYFSPNFDKCPEVLTNWLLEKKIENRIIAMLKKSKQFATLHWKLFRCGEVRRVTEALMRGRIESPSQTPRS